MTSNATGVARAAVPEAADPVRTAATRGVNVTEGLVRPRRYGRMTWIVSIAIAVGVLGLWWNIHRSQQLAAEAKAQAEATAIRVTAEAKVIADAAAAKKAADDAAAAKLVADAAAAQKAADEAAAKAAAEAKMLADAKAAADAAAAEARRMADAKADADKGNSAAELARKAKAEADLNARDAQAAAEAKAAEARRMADAKAETDRINASAELARKVKAEADLKERDVRAAAEAKAQSDRSNAAGELARKEQAEADLRERDARAAAAAKAAADAQAAGLQAKVAACRSTLSEISATNRINFEFASAALKPDSKPGLDKVANAIKACPATRIRVEGHTDADGDETRNQRLSEARAKSVQAYLEQAGIETDRLTAIGYGQTRPAVPNTTVENKLANRRIEFALEKY